MMIGMGLQPFASPTARTAFGFPIFCASCPYEMVSPYGIMRRLSHTRSWNSVPSGASGKSNSLSSPSKYAFNCRIASTNAALSSLQSGSTGAARLLLSKLSTRRPAASVAKSSLPTGLSIMVQETALAGCNFLVVPDPSIFASLLLPLDSIGTPGSVSLLEFFARAHRLHIRDAIHRQDPIQVIDFMLQRLGKISFVSCARFVPLPAQVLIPHGDLS